jgi:hypothetical protein
MMHNAVPLFAIYIGPTKAYLWNKSWKKIFSIFSIKKINIYLSIGKIKEPDH